MGRSVLQRLLDLIRLFLAKANTAFTKPLVRLLRAASALWSILRSRLRAGNSKRGPRPPQERQQALHDPRNDPRHEDSERNDNHDSAIITTSTPEGGLNTQPTPHIIPLDSSTSYSLHPYPYIHDDHSRSSVSVGHSRARAAHSLAVASHRNGSRSSHHLSSHNPSRVHTPEPHLRISMPPRFGEEGSEDEYTFKIKSPDQPNSPGTPWRSPTRTFSTSMPDLTSPRASGTSTYPVSQQIADSQIVPQTSQTTASPLDSLEALGEAGVSPSERDPDFGLFHSDVIPMTPEWFSRYTKYRKVSDQDATLTIPAFNLDFQQHKPPEGWVPILHPEGVLYFYNQAKHVVTETDMYDPMYYGKVIEHLGVLEDFVKEHKLVLPDNYTLALDTKYDPEEGKIISEYYFADHDRRVIFFFDRWEASNFKSATDIPGISNMLHARHAFEAQYWQHCMMYPVAVTRLQEAVSEMKDLILHFIGDMTTSAFSTSPYELDELYRILSLANSMKKLPMDHTAGAASIIGRIMYVFNHNKLVHWAGTPERRLLRDSSVYGNQPKRSWLIRTLSPVLFNAPDTHLYNLGKLWVDGIMHTSVWMQRTKKLNEEWSELILYATVLLNANVALLAIQSIDVDQPNTRSPVQIASYLSIVSSIGCILIGLLLIRQNRRREHNTANDVGAFLKKRTHPTLGLETLAILYSMPYALLLWGMISFVAAFAWNCFDNSNISTRCILGFAWCALFALIIWCVWMGWDREPSEVDQVPDEEVLPSPLEKPDCDGAEGEDCANNLPTLGNGSLTYLPNPRFSAIAGSNASITRMRTSRPHSPHSVHGSAQHHPARPGSRASDASTQPAGSIRNGMYPLANTGSIHEHRGSIRGGVDGEGQDGTGGGKRWKWTSFVSKFWNSRRTSVDSEKTMVTTNV